MGHGWDRDRIVAEIVPPALGRSLLLADAMVADAVRQGWIAPPALVASGSQPRKPVMSFDELMRGIEADER